MDSKTCCRCGAEKSLAEFSRRTKAVDGLNPACKPCLVDDRRIRRAKSPEDRERELLALANRPEKRCSACGDIKPRAEFRTKARSASRDGMAPKCLACESAWHREHYTANRDRLIREHRDWYEANRDERRDSRRAWYERNLHKFVEYNSQRRARIAGAHVGDVNLDALWTGECGICRRELDRAVAFPDPLSKSLDHVIPLARGGAHSQENLQWVHLWCNKSKGARMAEEVSGHRYAS